MPGNIVPALRRRDPDLFKAPDRDVRRAENIFPFVDRIGTEIESKGFRIEPVVEIGEDLVEVIGTNQDLVRQLRREGRILHERIVKNVDRRIFEVILEVRACCTQRWTAPSRLGLIALTSE